jgi:hypothetical protein
VVGFSHLTQGVSSRLDSAPRAPLRLPLARQRVRPHCPKEVPFFEGTGIVFATFVCTGTSPTPCGSVRRLTILSWTLCALYASASLGRASLNSPSSHQVVCSLDVSRGFGWLRCGTSIGSPFLSRSLLRLSLSLSPFGWGLVLDCPSFTSTSSVHFSPSCSIFCLTGTR